jgi:MFS family permease
MTRKIFTRDFILTFWGLFALTFVFYILIPTLPIYLSGLGSTEIEIGVLIGIFSFSSVAVRPLVGKTLLKISEKTFMIAGAYLFTLTSVAYLLAPPFWPFLIVRVFQGIGFAFFHTAAFTLIANISSKGHRGQSIGYFILAFNLSAALAPPLGIFLINRFNFTFLFLTCVGLSLCALFIIYKLGKRQVVPLENSSMKDSFLLSRKALPSSVVGFFSLFIWGAITAFFSLYAINHGMANPGLFFTTIAIMLILCRALGGKIFDLHSKEKIILPCLTIYIITMVFLAFSKTLPMFIFVAVLYGIGAAFLIPTLVVYTLDRAGSSPGPPMGTYQAFTDLGMGMGPVVMGFVIQSTSYPIMFLCLGLIGIINLNYFYFFVRGKGAVSPEG